MAITSDGEGEDQVVAAHDDLIKKAPPVGGGSKSQRHAKADADPHRNQRHGDGGLRADHQHRQHVAAELIRAEHIGCAGRLQPVGDGDARDGVGRPDEAEERRSARKTAERRADQEGFGQPGHRRRSLGSTRA
jgi:hypothetical protein